MAHGPWPDVDSREVLELGRGFSSWALANVVMRDQGRMRAGSGDEKPACTADRACTAAHGECNPQSNTQIDKGQRRCVS
jgi:hypothetical protein